MGGVNMRDFTKRFKAYHSDEENLQSYQLKFGTIKTEDTESPATSIPNFSILPSQNRSFPANTPWKNQI